MNDLALALIYLSAWKEKGDEVYREWKGYDFTILDELKKQGLINLLCISHKVSKKYCELKKQGLIDLSYKAKSLSLSEEGEEKAKQLIEKFKQAV